MTRTFFFDARLLAHADPRLAVLTAGWALVLEVRAVEVKEAKPIPRGEALSLSAQGEFLLRELTPLLFRLESPSYLDAVLDRMNEARTVASWRARWAVFCAAAARYLSCDIIEVVGAHAPGPVIGPVNELTCEAFGTVYTG